MDRAGGAIRADPIQRVKSVGSFVAGTAAIHMNDTAPEMPLGIEGFTYADLHAPARLKELYELFCAQVGARDPQLWSEWDAYRLAPDAVQSPIAVSDLIVRMAPHVSRFVTTLFGVGDASAALHGRTTSLEPLFRFKVDFVRKRALPLVKGGAHVAVTEADAAAVVELARPYAHLDRELAIATAGCDLLDREIAVRSAGGDDDKAAVAAQLDALKRWCAGCLHDPGYRPWVIFRFPETIDYFNLVQVRRPRPELPERFSARTTACAAATASR